MQPTRRFRGREGAGVMRPLREYSLDVPRLNESKTNCLEGTHYNRLDRLNVAVMNNHIPARLCSGIYCDRIQG